MHRTFTPLLTLALLLHGEVSTKPVQDLGCRSIGGLRLDMKVAAASRQLKGAVFVMDTVIDSATTASANYTVLAGMKKLEGVAELIAVQGRVRHIHFRHELRDRLPIEDCGSLAWKESPPGNPGNVYECWVISPSIELLVNRSGPGVSLGLVNTDFAANSISASEAKVMSRQACSKGG